MQYTTTNYPPAMKNLPDDALEVAVEETNRFLEAGYRQGRAIAMGIARARDWRENGKTFDAGSPQGPDLHVLFDKGTWTICPDGASSATHAFDDLDQALRRAHELAIRHRSALYVYSPEGDLIEKSEAYGEQPDDTNTLEVAPDDGSWVLRNGSFDDRLGRFSTKRAAVEAARSRAREARSRLIIRYQNGDVQREHDYTS